MNEDISSNQNPEPERPEQPKAEEPMGQQQMPPQGPQATPPPPPGAYYQAPPQYRPYQPPPQDRRGWLIPVSLAIGCLPWAILFFLFLIVMIGSIGGAEHGKSVALIHITGEITGGQSSAGVFSGSVVGSEDVVREMERIRKKSSVKAVVLRINSPGGSAAGSEEIYNEIIRLRKSGKVVYASMGDIAASGGYYIASACDKIYANSNTLTGSIGVIFSLADLSSLYKKIGYSPEVVKAGKYKDIGSPSRPLTAEERSLLQALVNDTYSNFLQSVADGRKMPLAQVKKLAEGRIYSGTQAIKVNLVDEIGGLRETVASAAKAGGIKGEPKVVEYGEKGLVESILGGESEAASDQLSGELSKEFMKKLLQQDSSIRNLR